MLEKVSLSSLVGIASFGLVAISLTGIFYHRKQQRLLRETPYFQLTLKTLKSNPKAVALLGEPIEVGFVNFSTPSQVLEENHVKLRVPLTGKVRKGYLDVDAVKDDKSESDWKLLTLNLRLDKGLENTNIIVYKTNS